jgi:hypothetical protein
MLETPHSLLGAAVGGATGNPFLAAPVAAASHFAGDILPHWNPSWPFRGKLTYAFVIADFVLALALVVAFWFIFPDRPEVAVGAFFGCLPDIILGIRYTFNVRWLQGYERAHGAIHNEVSPLHGIWPQTVVSLLSIWYLTKL